MLSIFRTMVWKIWWASTNEWQQQNVHGVVNTTTKPESWYHAAAASWSCDESDHVSKGATQLQGNEQKLYKKVAHVKVHIITNLTKSNLHNNTDIIVASLNHTPMIAFCTKHSPFVFHLAISPPTDHRCCCLQMSPKGWWPPWLGCW